MFFRLSSFELGLMLFGIVLGTTLLGVLAGRRLRTHAETLREPFGILQAALLGLVALILAFGLTMAVGRYDSRRAAVVAEANAIGTTYLRAQTLQEPMRTRSLELLERYTDTSIVLSGSVPGSRAAERRDRGRRTPAALALASRGRVARRIADRQRSTALRRDPERDDRPPDGPRLGAEQPRADGGARDRDRRRRGRSRPARALPRDPVARRHQRRPGRARSSRCSS